LAATASSKKGYRPPNQPVGCNDAYAVGGGGIEPVKASLDERSLPWPGGNMAQ
jgi:hypothetical protein